MHFPYCYVKHSIETFQVWLEHLVKEVWCKPIGEFSENLLHADLKAVVLEIYDPQTQTKRGKAEDWLYTPIKKIYGICKTELSSAERQRMSTWYDHNNDIEALCAGDSSKQPGTYAQIGAINADLEEALKKFCISLYDRVIGLSAVTSRIGELGAHYADFAQANKAGKCPYCGYGDIKGEHHTRREAYDHFLPKATYPFNSVNFRNLAPMCHDCNSNHKKARDPIHRKDAITRRKAFYSYASSHPEISVTMTLKTKDVTNLEPKDIDLQLTAPGHEEEVEAWRDIFGIDERYKAKCCGESDGIAWLQSIIEDNEEGENCSTSPAERLKLVLRDATSRPYANVGFLKKAFLDACVAAKIIRVAQEKSSGFRTDTQRLPTQNA